MGKIMWLAEEIYKVDSSPIRVLQIEVDKATNTNVWISTGLKRNECHKEFFRYNLIDGKRIPRKSEYNRYKIFETREEAYSYYIEKFNNDIKTGEDRISSLKMMLKSLIRDSIGLF